MDGLYGLKDVIVFVVGGGNYIEAQNLSELSTSKTGGYASPSTSLLSPG